MDGPLASTLGALNPLRYRSYVYDTETGYYYLQSRYYDPEIGRFINADALVATGQGILGNNMFAYCRNNPVRRKDVSGTVDVEIFDGDSNPLDDDRVIAGGTASGSSFGGNGVYGGKGGGGKSVPGGSANGTGSGSSISNSNPAQTYPSNASAPGGNSSIPKYAYDTLEYVKSHNGSPPQGYKGGGQYANDGRNGSAYLPDCYAPYREYDVHPKVAGQDRGVERIVVGNGVAFYTPNHYISFIVMEQLI